MVLISNSAVATANQLKRIGFLGFDGVAALDFTGPLEAFAHARKINYEQSGAPCYQVIVIGLTDRSFVSESGVVFRAQQTIETATDLDTIIVPGGSGLRQLDTMKRISGWLAAQAKQCRRIVAISGGIYPLAQSGLLDGRQVTTHWRFLPEIARQFPKLQLKTTAPFVKDGGFHTCGGGTAGIEMCLALIQEDYGAQIALALARELLVRLRPAGEDEDLLDLSHYQSAPFERLAELPAWILAHLHRHLTVETLAERVCLCPRHFSRLFKSSYGCTPADYVDQLRLSEARRRLQTSRHSIDSVAAAVGFKSADVFRRAFERRLGISPSGYRREFQARLQNVTNSRDASRSAFRSKKRGR